MVAVRQPTTPPPQWSLTPLNPLKPLISPISSA